MPAKVFVKMGFLPATSTGQGMCAAFPDVCKTPAPPTGVLPIPYPNIAQLSDFNCSSKVKIQNKKTIRKGDKCDSSNGDNAGVAGGVVSSRNMAKCEIALGDMKVKAEGKDIGHMGSMTEQNKGGSANIVGAVAVVMQ